MTKFAFAAHMEPGVRKRVVVTFPDVPEAVTEGRDEAEARAMAEEALGLALLTYPLRGLPLPKPRPGGKKLVSISPAPDVTAKLALLDAVRAAGMNKADFARLIGKDVREARRILDPRHPTKLPTLTEALARLGKRLVITVEDVSRPTRNAA
jgi:antitoxin HicB